MKKMAKHVPKRNNNLVQKNTPVPKYGDHEQTETNNVFDLIDKYYQANLGKVTASISPAAIATSYLNLIKNYQMLQENMY
jgi:polyhydroxyalkanoate synthase subunit PhaC